MLWMNVCLTSFCWAPGQQTSREGRYMQWIGPEIWEREEAISSPKSYRLLVSGLIAFLNFDNWLLIDFCASPDWKQQRRRQTNRSICHGDSEFFPSPTHLFLFLCRAQNLPSLLFYLQTWRYRHCWSQQYAGRVSYELRNRSRSPWSLRRSEVRFPMGTQNFFSSSHARDKTKDIFLQTVLVVRHLTAEKELNNIIYSRLGMIFPWI